MTTCVQEEVAIFARAEALHNGSDEDTADKGWARNCGFPMQKGIMASCSEDPIMDGDRSRKQEMHDKTRTLHHRMRPLPALQHVRSPSFTSEPACPSYTAR